MAAIIGVKAQLIIIPHTTNISLPVTHLIFDDIPDSETKVAAIESPKPNTKHKIALANNGSLDLS